jgi:hypothetical protein
MRYSLCSITNSCRPPQIIRAKIRKIDLGDLSGQMSPYDPGCVKTPLLL